jgi:protein BCP1
MTKRDCEESSDYSESEDDGLIDHEEVDVDFEFCHPTDIHFHGIKTLIRNIMSTDFESINLSEMSEFIIKQASVTSIVKVDDHDDPYALMTVISSLSVFTTNY